MSSPYNAWGVYDMRPVPLRGMGSAADWNADTLVSVLKGMYPQAFVTSPKSFKSMIDTLMGDEIDGPPSDCGAFHPGARLCCALIDLYKQGMSQATGRSILQDLIVRLRSENTKYVQGMYGGMSYFPEFELGFVFARIEKFAWGAAHGQVLKLPAMTVATKSALSAKLPAGASKGKKKCPKVLPCKGNSTWDNTKCKCVSKSKLGPLTMEGGGGAQTIGTQGKKPADVPLYFPGGGGGGGGAQQEADVGPEAEVESGDETPAWVVPAVISGAILLAVVGVVAMKK